VPNTQDARAKGYDGGKQVSGIKRHIGVDTEGLPHVIDVTRANTDDRQGIAIAIRRNRDQLDRVESVLGDGGYDGQNFADTIARDLDNATVQIARRPESHAFKVLPQRWVVERSFAWLEQCRRLWKNCERYLNTSLQFVNLAFLSLLLRRL
jgi:transposase